MSPRRPPPALGRALRALNRRPYATAELRRWLERRGCAAVETAAALAWLTERGFLNDHAFAKDFASGRAARQRWGPRRIARTLRARGLDPSCVEAALETLTGELDPRRLLRDLIDSRGGVPSDRRAYARLWHLALRRGYPPDLIQELLGPPPAPARPKMLELAALLVALLAAQSHADIYQKVGARSFTNIPSGDAVAVIHTPPSPRQRRHHDPGANLSDLIGSTAARTGLSPALLTAVIEAESGFDPNAVSPKGARGLMQLMPATADRLGVDQIHDPQQNLEGGARYLKYLIDLFHGDLSLALAAYNSGENLVQRLGRIPRIAETQDYVTRIVERFGTAQHPFSPRSADAAPVPRSRIFASRDARGVWSFSSAPIPSSSLR